MLIQYIEYDSSYIMTIKNGNMIASTMFNHSTVHIPIQIPFHSPVQSPESRFYNDPPSAREKGSGEFGPFSWFGRLSVRAPPLLY